jgi:hypothetical protein
MNTSAAASAPRVILRATVAEKASTVKGEEVERVACVICDFLFAQGRRFLSCRRPRVDFWEGANLPSTPSPFNSRDAQSTVLIDEDLSPAGKEICR